MICKPYQHKTPPQSRGGVLEIRRNMEHPERKANRLKGYDYGSVGAYFITICTKNGDPLFWNENTEAMIRACLLSYQPVGAMATRDSTRDGSYVMKQSEMDRIRPFLSAEGKIVDRAIQDISLRYQNVTVDHCVIMPNHVHLLLQLTKVQNDSSVKSVSGIVGQTKRRISKEIGKTVWQKSFHDHIVRDEADLQRIWTYIENNPANWESDCFYR